MQLPEALLDSLESVNGFNREAFVKVHASAEQVTSIRINPLKSSIENGECLPDGQAGIHQKIPWTEYGHYLTSRPSFTFDPLFHAGCYYVQEASSMFLEQALKQTVDLSKPLRVLDLCAAPGGKSTHILSLISKESLLVSNEVIRTRVNILNDNIIKWGRSNVAVTTNDPKDFQWLKNYFDVIVVDAPCSGSGLFRREPEAISEWSEQNVVLCSQRQQRIISDVLPALKPGGVLIYSTCSYSKEEDEEITGWLLSECPPDGQAGSMVNVQLAFEREWGIVQSDIGYRFWPYKLKGEGFYIACFRKEGDIEEDPAKQKAKPEKFSNQEWDLIRRYVNAEGLALFSQGKTIHALPENLLAELFFLRNKLKVINAGIRIGEIIRDKLIPDHALAMSTVISRKIPAIELEMEQAIQYLRKRELALNTDKKGWSLVTFAGHPLGWINILSNRINNYYPKELRILKE
jgi:16S rRNA C967 or C1407 C5-methylase (RsmB/RsmF family)/NOL1/NOP2/fmu family ribosome biogenesis protein